MGKVQVAQGRFEDGLSNLQSALSRAVTLVERDPANGLSQNLLAELLQESGNASVKAAGAPGISRARKVELLQKAVADLTRCQEKLHSKELERVPRLQLAKQRNEVASALNEALTARAKVVGEAENEPSKP